MKRILTALASVALVSAPLAAHAQHNGGFRGGAFHTGGGFHGGYGYRGGHYGGWGYGWGAAGLGFALGAALADPWYYGPGYYGYYGWYGPPAPVVYYDQPGYVYAPAPPQAAQQSGCGQWSWDQSQSRYNWIPGPCAPAAAPTPAQTY
jgi:hypothetical protein